MNKFDHRSRTRLSTILNLNAIAAPVEDELSSSSSTDPDSIIKWVSMSKISSLIYNANFKLKYGNVTCFNLSTDFIVFGTEKGFSIVVDYNQNVHNIVGIDNKQVLSAGAVTAIAISQDSTYIASGHQYGAVLIWDLMASIVDPVLFIGPVTINDKVNGKEGHLNRPINHLCFVKDRHTAVISADVDGLVLFHDGYRNILGYHSQVRKILGSSDLNFTKKSDRRNSSFLSRKSKTFVAGCSVLPLGAKPSKIDSLNLVAVITYNFLLVISISPQLTTQLRLGKPKLLDNVSTAALSWYPETVIKGKSIPPRLAYSFANILTVVELATVSTFHDEKELVTIEVSNKKRWACEELISSVLWLSAKILLAMTVSSRILVIDTGLVRFKLNEDKSLRCIGSIDAISNHIIYNNYLTKLVPMESSNELAISMDLSYFNTYEHTMKTFKNGLFVLTNNHKFSMGTLVNWEAHLTQIIQPKDLQSLKKALSMSLKFYTGDCDLVKYKLSEDDDLRKSAVKPILDQLIFACFEEIFSKPYSVDELTDTLNGSFAALVAMKSSPEAYEQVYEYFETHKDAKGYFFATVESSIFSRKISSLSPKVMKDLILYFVNVQMEKAPGEKQAQIDRLEEMICLLDVKQIDLDLVLSLCEKYNLIDIKIFIWNSMMKDYITPLMDFYISIKKVIYGVDTSELSKKQSLKVYTYLTYTLTGRQYPLESSIDDNQNGVNNIKMNLYYILFSGGSIEWPLGSGEVFFVSENPISDEPSFPYLYLLLKFDVENTLLMLNEVLEDDFLNGGLENSSEDKSSIRYLFEHTEFVINRQYIIEVLIQFVKFNSDLFDDRNRILLCVFVLRNYPKYSQFIRINDSTLDHLIETVCDVCSLEGQEEKSLKSDCELSLQSLLSIYQPTNLNSELIYYFEKNRFDNLLFSLYRSEGNSNKLMKIWIQNPNTSFNGVVYTHYEIVQLGFSLVYEDDHIINSVEYQEFVDTLKSNFESILKNDTGYYDLIKVLNRYSFELNREIYSVKDEEVKYQYLTTLFNIIYEEDIGDACLAENDLVKYLTILCNRKQSTIEIMKKSSSRLMSKTVVDQLLQIFDGKDIEGVVYLLRDVKHDNVMCLEKVTKYLKSLVTLDIETSDLEKNLWKYLNIAIGICREVTLIDSQSGVELWPKLNVAINSLIETAEQQSKEDKRSQTVVDVSRRLLQEIFVSLMMERQETDDENQDHSINNNSLFLQIFNKFLEDKGSEAGVTRIKDVLDIVNQIYLINTSNCESLKLTLNLYNKEVKKNLDAIEEENDRGITPVSVDCLGCGKKIWGKKMSYKVIQSWQDFQTKKLQYQIDHNQKINSSRYVEEFQYCDSVWKELKVVVFKCGHGYHHQCVQNLGGEMRCLVCHG